MTVLHVNAMKTVLTHAGFTEERDDEYGKEQTTKRRRNLPVFDLRVSIIPFQT